MVRAGRGRMRVAAVGRRDNRDSREVLGVSARTSSCHACEEIVLQYAKLGGFYSVQTPRDFAMVRSWRICPFKRLYAAGDTVGRSRSSHYLLEPQAVLHGRQVSEIQRTTEEAGHGAEESEEGRRSG